MAKDSILARQYDRVIALVVLLGLLVSLAWLTFFGLQKDSIQNRNDDELERKIPKNSLTNICDMTEFSQALQKIEKPEANKILLKVPDVNSENLFTASSRVLCVGCARPIPLMADDCIFCGKTQPKEKTIDPNSVDSDGDGMPDAYELANKLDPNNAEDADADADKDGFSNIEEFRAKTDPNDPKSHPEYATRMSIAGISGKSLPIKLISAMKTPDGKHLITFVVDGKRSQCRVKEGSEIGNDDYKTGFRVVKYTKLEGKASVGDDKQIRYFDASTAEIERISDKKLVTLVTSDSKNPKPSPAPLLEQVAKIKFDLPNVEPVEVIVGQKFKVLGESYTVKAIDGEKSMVKIEKDANLNSFLLN